MAVGPVSRLPFAPLPDSRSLVPVSVARAQPVRTGKADRDAARRIRRIGDQESDTATAETEVDRAEPAPRSGRSETLPHDAGMVRSTETGQRGWSAPGTAPFVTQVLAQEVLKSGLYIEPWRQAINAYERAAEAGGPTLRFPMP
jgi:hypothetical protein